MLVGGLALHNKIEELRNSFGYTQQQFADTLEVSRQTISSLEHGRYNPSLLLAFKISKVFHLPIEQIFWEDNKEDL